MNPNPLAVDTETTGFQLYGGDRIIMASFADATGAWAARPDEARDTLTRAVESGRKIIMHNALFDRAVFKQAWGLEIPDDQVWDTMAVDWLLDENRDHRLKEGLGTRVFGLDAAAEKRALAAIMRGRTQAEVYKELRADENKKPRAERESAAETRERARKISAESKLTWADMTYEILEDYAIQDADLTYKLYQHQANEEIPADSYIEPYLDQAASVAGVTFRINDRGIAVSEEMAVQGMAEVQERIDTLSSRFEGVNLKSPAQVAELLYDEWELPIQGFTDSGNRVTDKNALNNLAYDTRVAALLEYRQLVKQVDAYFVPLLDAIGLDNRIHPTLHPFRTVTGRYSCSSPNLQTIPRESTSSAVRKVFVPGPGLVLSEWDLSQVEVRIAADLSQEPSLLQNYEEGGDVYQALADEIGVTRAVAKTVLLSAQYGVGARTLARTLALGTGKRPDEAVAKQILRRYWANYSRLSKVMDGLSERAQRRGYIPLWKPGRRRRFESPYNPYPRYYTALNAVIQGGAAEFLKDVMILLDPEITNRGYGQIVLTVHDSIVVEHEPGAEAGIQQLFDDITRDVSPYRVPMVWEGKQWG